METAAFFRLSIVERSTKTVLLQRIIQKVFTGARQSQSLMEAWTDRAGVTAQVSKVTQGIAK